VKDYFSLSSVIKKFSAPFSGLDFSFF